MLNFEIFDSFIDGIVIVDNTSRILYFNPILEQHIGLSLKRIQRSNKNLEEVFDLDLKSQIAGCIDSLPYEEFTVFKSSGKNLRAQISLKRISPDEVLLYIRDVTLEETLQRKYRAELDQKESYINELKIARDKLKDYSENLEILVEARTQEVKRLSHTQKALLDSLTQGFFLFRADGSCDEVHSQSCLKLLNTSPPGKKVWDVFGLNPKEAQAFEKWMKVVFPEVLPFADVAPLGIPELKKEDGTTLSIEYFPMRNSSSAIEALVVVVTDITEIILAKNLAIQSKAQAQMIIELVKAPDRTQRYFDDAHNLLKQCQDSLRVKNKEELFRYLHTLKACFATFEMTDLASLVHTLEDSLRPELTPEWVNIEDKVKLLSEQFESFLKEHSFLNAFFESGSKTQSEEIREWVSSLPLPYQKTFHIIETTDSFKKTLEPLSETATQVALQVQKPAPTISIQGSELRIPKKYFDELTSSFVHIIRNSLDHGIESTEERLNQKKSPHGHIQFFWTLKAQELILTISDDGRGVNISKLRSKLQKAHLSDDEVLQHIFSPQLSTKDEVTELSGRGVGLDAVKAACEKLGGTIHAQSYPGQGLKMMLKIPLPEQILRINNIDVPKAA